SSSLLPSSPPSQPSSFRQARVQTGLIETSQRFKGRLAPPGRMAEGGRVMPVACTSTSGLSHPALFSVDWGFCSAGLLPTEPGRDEQGEVERFRQAVPIEISIAAEPGVQVGKQVEDINDPVAVEIGRTRKRRKH